MERLEEPSPIIVYFEDPSYARVPDEESREIIRRWRFKLERVLGLYNAKLIHTCTDECLKPIVFDEKDEENEGGHKYEFVAGPIDSRHNLFGCPRSGIVHWCPPQGALRKRACTFQSLNSIGETVCRFSGRLIEGAEWEYDRYIDTTVNHVSHSDQNENSQDRNARIASGLDKNNQNVVHVTQQEKEEKERAVVEQKSLQSVNRSLESRYKRNQNKTNPNTHDPVPPLSLGGTAHSSSSSSGNGTHVTTPFHVVPVIERSPRKVSAMPTPRGSISLDSTEASAIAQALSTTSQPGGASGIKRKMRYEAGHGLSVTLDTHRSMKRIIIDLIASPGSHTAMHHETPALDSVAHAYVELCVKRVAKIYALVSKERELDKQRSHDRNHRGGACVGLNVRELTVTTLYTYARGYNIENENLIPRDEYLAKLLPIARNLQWYGIDPTMRQHLLETNERLPKSSKIYDESMTTKAFVQIQQMINNFPRGKVILRGILEDD